LAFFFSGRRRHTSFSRDWSSDVCSSDLGLLLSILSPVAFAQQAAAPEPEPGARTLDTVQVTGSRIRRAELETQVPVQVLSREDIDRSGFTSVAEVVQYLTASGAALNSKSNS